jgi:hypothetical protein
MTVVKGKYHWRWHKSKKIDKLKSEEVVFVVLAKTNLCSFE